MRDLKDAHSHFTPNYNPAPFVVDRGLGSKLWDSEGNEYLDFSSGIAVSNLGHSHPAIVKAVQEQAGKLIHTSNLFWNESSIQLAEMLTRLSFADQVFFTNSGTEANEAALKLARKFFFDQGKARPKFLAFKKGFHGRTFASLSATEKESYRKPYEPVVPGFEFAEFNNLKSLEILSDEFAGVIFEPVQGEGGIYPCSKEFVQALRRKCNETGSLLIADCIQVGIYRTDCRFGYETLEIEPDIMSLAKSLASGMPIGAMLTTKKIGDHFQPGSHGSTFGGNPVSAAAAVATLNVIEQSDFQTELCNKMMFLRELVDEASKWPRITACRLKGMMLGIDIDCEEITPVFNSLRDHRVLVTKIAPKTLRVLPPLVASRQDFEVFFDTLKKVLE